MKNYPRLVVADKSGRIFDVPELEAVGMKAGKYFRLSEKDLVKLHPDSELFILPDRIPVGFDPLSAQMVAIDKTKLSGKEKTCFPVAAFLAPGFTALYNSSYKETKKAKTLPLFSYSALAFYKGEFYACCVRVDREKRQILEKMDLEEIALKVNEFREVFPENRLVRHLEKCALTYGCPAAKNFFLSRYEAPLPSSPVCNSRCIGCISYQPDNRCSVTQPRIKFVPTAVEIAEIALYHIKKVKDPVVSFGQGCEGEPLMVADVMIEAVKIIRGTTKKGIINVNTNASKPIKVKKLFNSGLDSIRVSLNSVREELYNAYYRPVNYSFRDVVRSIKEAKNNGGFVSINYLVIPGVTDSMHEFDELRKFIRKTKVDMIQWRNLNIDPLAYFREIKVDVVRSELIGMKVVMKELKREFPHIMFGYFNPSKERIKRARRQKF